MIYYKGCDVICDCCNETTHCAENQPWPHNTVYVARNPRQDDFSHMLKLDLCEKCWPLQKATEENTRKNICEMFIDFIKRLI